MDLKKSLRHAMLALMHATGMHRLSRSDRKGLLVLAFHKVPDRDAFERKMLILKELCDIASVGDFLEGKLDPERLSAAVTFDDGFASVAENALPVLKKHSMPAVIFLTSGFLDSRDKGRFCRENLGVRPAESMTWEQARTVSEDFELGGHGRGHVDLASLSPADALKEIAEDRERIKKKTGKKPRYFAYPLGGAKNISETARKAAERAGYEAAFTILPGVNQKGTDRFLLRRISVDPGMSDTAFKSAVLGNYRRLKAAKDALAR